MIEIRYADELGGMSALEGNPKMESNCYYIAGKKAEFNDYPPGRLLENAGLTAWQSHISGDSGSFEADPALGADYMPANPRCAGMGIASGLSAPAKEAGLRKTKTYAPGQFVDVDENAWYGSNKGKSIETAYEYGLMQGESATVFNPAKSVTVAETISIAARVHRLYGGDGGEFTPEGVWYKVFVDYAVANGIINAGDFSDFGRAATRAEIAYIFSRALPASEFEPQNAVNSLPDVNGGMKYGASVITLYKAGVLAGSDDAGTFGYGDAVTRAETAAIVSRVIVKGLRVTGRSFG